MRAGALRNRVTIQRRVETQDAAGQPLDDWINVATVWADVRNPTGLGAVRADAQAQVVKTSIRVRWRTDIEPGMRAVFGTSVYEIGAVLPDHTDRSYVDLVCGAAQ